MEFLTLASDQLRLVLEPPGEGYRGSRFDWTTQVRRISFLGHEVLTQELPPEQGEVAGQGVGLAGEFGIATPLGFEDCAVDDWFPKVGVGLLRRPDEEPYHFFRSYEVRPARFSVRPEGPSAVTLTADQSVHRGWGWFLKRHWAVRANRVTLTTTLANTGTLPLGTEEYNHNFLSSGPRDAIQWKLSWPADIAHDQRDEWVDPEGILGWEGNSLAWAKTPSEVFFFSARAPLSSWTLHRGDLSVTEEVDFASTHFNLWGRAHVISPELYHGLGVAPGTTHAWTRTWAFQEGAGPK